MTILAVVGNGEAGAKTSVNDGQGQENGAADLLQKSKEVFLPRKEEAAMRNRGCLAHC